VEASRLSLAAALITAATGCGVSPGDYLVFRINLGEAAVSDSCYGDDGPPEDVADDSDSFRQPQTWVIYYGAGDELVLDASGFSLQGEETGDGFEFVADQIDVTYAGVDQQEARVNEQTTTTVTMNTDGDAVEGNIVALMKVTCDFLTAAPTPGVCSEVPDCTQTSPFSGVKLEDVQLEEGVDRPNDEIGGGPPPPDPNDPQPGA